jgi:hypothetical protein
MKNTMAILRYYLMIFGLSTLCLEQVQADNTNYSTTVALANAAFYYYTNSGVVTESVAIAVASSSTITVNPGETLSGTILFANDESMVVTNSTGSPVDNVFIDFEQVTPNVEVYDSLAFQFQLLGVSGQLASPNPYTNLVTLLYDDDTSLTPYFLNLTPSSVSFNGIAYVLTNNTPYSFVVIFNGVGFTGASGDYLQPASSMIPQVAIVISGKNAILTWPTSASGYALQSTTNLVSASSWVTHAASPVVINGQNTVTNPITGSPLYFRLKSN